MGARRYRVTVGAAAVVAVLEWRRMRGVGGALDVSDGRRRVGSDVSDVGGAADVVSGRRRTWRYGGGVECVRCGGAGAANVVLERWRTLGCRGGGWCRGDEVAAVFVTESGRRWS